MIHGERIGAIFRTVIRREDIVLQNETDLSENAFVDEDRSVHSSAHFFIPPGIRISNRWLEGLHLR